MEVEDQNSDAIDLTDCEREPIHLLGGIQPQGCLLAIDPTCWQVVQWSINLPAILGIPKESLAGLSIAELIEPEAFQTLQQVADSRVEGVSRTFSMQWLQKSRAERHLAAAHLFQDILILEVEIAKLSDIPFIATLGRDSGTIPQFLRTASAEMQATTQLRDLYMKISSLVRELNGFDRVMVYRFLADGHGEVVGEAFGSGFESFLGLHYPASDIPPQARRLYELNPIRSIADLNATPVPVTPVRNPVHGEPLDLTYSVFRSVSRVHIEYLRNMGVAASMSISILQGGRLWGLIACHHYSPRYLPLELRISCELLGTMAGNYLTSRSIAEDVQLKSHRQDQLSHAMRIVAAGNSQIQGINSAADMLLKIMDCSGIAIFMEDRVLLHGSTITREQAVEVRDAVMGQMNGHLWSTEKLSDVIPPNSLDPSIACGALSIRIGADARDQLIFFRPEYRYSVSWGGNPDKSFEVTPDGLKLSPRRSFAVWMETVRGRSVEWSATDHFMAEEIFTSLHILAARRSLELQRLNLELTRINSDLDSFAFAASHDLREPLRSINQLIYLLELDLGPEETKRVQHRLESLKATAVRMDLLLEALLRLSRVGRRDLEIEQIAVREIVDEAAQIAFGRQEPGKTIQLVVSDLPVLDVDFMCVREIFVNLFTNASKYNNRSVREISVAYGPAPQTGNVPKAAAGQNAFVVRDNGIGIAEKNLAGIFEIFRRLHPDHHYGGGAGAGLSIVRKVVERHGGVIWVESVVGEGSAFWFTLNTKNQIDQN